MIMTPLEEQSLTKRVITTLVIVIAVILILALIGWTSGRWEARGQQLRLTLAPSKWDRAMLELDKRALELAYITKVQQLFDIWVRSGLETDENAVKGHAQAQRAYIESQRRIELREQELREREQRK